MNSQVLSSFSPGSVSLTDRELQRRRRDNYSYMMRLSSDNLLQNYLNEAGLNRGYGNGPGEPPRHGGWEDPFCQMRGHFLGHWLSAAGMHWAATGDVEIRAKADRIVERLAECQQENGGEWVAGIPEKFLHWIARGKGVWSPQYNVHKILMGLVDYYEYTGNRQALEIADNFSRWFTRWSSQFDTEKFNRILDVETGGMLEVWCQLYAATGKPEHRALMDKYYRAHLFDALLRGEDVLTNMHANSTVPEVLGAARAYEVTGDEKWMNIVKSYWDLAVTKRGTYVTGGQTCGEIWTPMHEMNLRLGEKNQEHCVVYNMMRLAAFLLRHTGDAVYADYWERNLYNGIMAQDYWDGRGDHTNGKTYDHPLNGLLTYFLPLHGGARKFWASETEDFFCCHGTLVQANASLADGIFYAWGEGAAVCQYFGASLRWNAGGTPVHLRQRIDPLSGTNFTSSALVGSQQLGTQVYDHDPNLMAVRIDVEAEAPVRFPLRLRVPSWAADRPVLTLNGEAVPFEIRDGWIELEREWEKDSLYFVLKKEIRAVPLPGDESRVAFCNGPVVLAGLCDCERALYLEEGRDPATLLEPFNEREWGSWKQTFRSVGQDRTIVFWPLYRIGYDSYTVYFPIMKK